MANMKVPEPVGAGGIAEARQVHALSVIRKMRGGAQADLVLTDDNWWYVVKWKQNPQHRRVLVNEVIGAELLRRLGIATPDWAMVYADQSLQHCSVPVEAGWHFGSKLPVNHEQKGIYDFIPSKLMWRVGNCSDFFAVYVFDLWVDHCDRRQAVFFGTPHRRFSAHMIGNGRSFGFDGTEWRMRDRPVGRDNPLLLGADAYLSSQAEERFESTIADIQSIPRSELEAIRQIVPAEWIEHDTEAIGRIFDELGRRAKRLPDLVASAREHLVHRLAPKSN